MTSEAIPFDRAVGYYDQTRGFPPGEERPSAALFASAGHLTAASRILEIGIGTGRIALPVSAHVSAIFGVDISRPMMERIRAKQNAEPIYPVEADGAYLPFGAGLFDAVVAVHIFHLIPNWKGVLREAARVLRPGAPLLHGWNQRSNRLFPADVWSAAMGPGEDARGGIAFAERETFLAEQGWRPLGAQQTHTYNNAVSPQHEVDKLRQRIWSGTWRMSDEQVEQSAALLQAYADAHYADPSEPVPMQDDFHVQAYLPPG